MNTLNLASALLPSGWARNVRLELDHGGNIAVVTADGRANGAERIDGAVLPGMPNLHSHAFQRAMAGLSETAGGGGTEDSFWTWREVMYRFVARLTPDDLFAVARQLYCEMLEAGFTAVAEFQYLHHDPDGRSYGDRAEMSRALIRAAQETGIGLTLLPVLYAAGGFGGKPAGEGQRRFLHSVDGYLRLVEILAGAHREDPQLRVGIAPHSLRAVPPEALRDAVVGLEGMDPDAPIHIHIAEQTKEVEDCLAWSALRPVDWLLQHAPVGPRWCLVHATHMTTGETTGLAATGAVVGLCPTTEANLGDGVFPLVSYLGASGRFGVGSDSHISVSPVEELRWLEYGQRLVARRRNVAPQGWAGATGAATGAGLHARALLGGAQACARPIGAIGQGRRADLVVLDAEHPLLVGREGERLVDSYVFAGNAPVVRHVMVGGAWVVRDGKHRDRERIAAAYRATIRRLAA
ncbi:MAG: formimidoylglutamate deiminase [Alphaproteobacteria bacterium]|nr:formimidoylglutamate deiminase [Alphaproteobacteria bacterium]